MDEKVPACESCANKGKEGWVPVIGGQLCMKCIKEIFAPLFEGRFFEGNPPKLS